LIHLVKAYTTFETNCSVPSISVNFVSPANIRSTLDILWSCLFTILACTWTVQHLNVPEQRNGQDPGWRGDIKWSLKRAWTSAKWMLATYLAPELLLSKNLADLLDVSEYFDQLAKLAKEDGVPWTRTHSLFANMGGFAIRSHVPERAEGRSLQEPSQVVTSEISSGQRVQDFEFAEGKNISTREEPSNAMLSVEEPQTIHPRTLHLIASDILALRQANLITKLPHITKEEIEDKSKSDKLIRGIAVIQIFWMLILIIARASRDLAISQLELSVIAFAICAIIIYILNWEKPKGVMVPITLLQYTFEIPRSVDERIISRNNMHMGVTTTLVDVLETIFCCGDPGFSLQVRNHFNRGRKNPWETFGFLLCSIILGVIHSAAWNFVFPTGKEVMIWRTCSIICTTAFPILAVIIFLFVYADTSSLPIFIVAILISPVYAVARLVLIVETFRTLCFLPPSAYVATWASNVPHVA